MNVSLEKRKSALSDRDKKRILVYALFAVASVILLMLASLQVAFLGLLIPMFLLFVAYAKNLTWGNMLSVYLAILFLVPIAMYTLIGNLPVDVEPNRIFAVLLLCAWLPLLLVDPGLKIRKTGLEAPMLALIASLLVSMMVNIDSYSQTELTKAFKAILLFAGYAFVFYLFASAVRGLAEVRSLVRWLVILTVVISFFGIIERVTGYNLFKHLHEFFPFLNVSAQQTSIVMVRGGLRISGPADHPLALAVLLAMFLPLVFLFIHQANVVSRKVLYGLGLLITLAAMLFTVSATALVGITAALVLQIFVNPRRGARLFFAVLFFALCASIIFHGDYEQLTERISYDYIMKHEIDNENGRLIDYPRVWQKFSEKPLFGIGFGTFDPLESQEHFALILDNQYLGFIIELGIFGTLSFLWFAFRLIRKLWVMATRSTGLKADLAGAMLSSIAAFMAMCFTFDSFGYPQVVYTFFILAGLSAALGLSNDPETAFPGIGLAS